MGKTSEKSFKTSFDTINSEFNKRNEFVTNIWILIVILSIIGIIIITQDDAENMEKVVIPFFDLKVSRNYFVILFIITLSGIIIKWIESFIRIVNFRIDVFESLLKSKTTTEINGIKIKTRALHDGLAYSGSSSIWSIVPDFKNLNNKLIMRLIRFSVYILLKFISMFAHFFIPAFSLIIAYQSLDLNSGSFWTKIFAHIALIFFFTVMIVLIRALLVELKYIIKVMKEQIFPKSK